MTAQYVRRSQEERIAELQSKIDAIKTRGERQKAKANPAVKLTVGAVKLLDKALVATADPEGRRTIEAARTSLGAFVAAQGWAVAPTVERPAPVVKRRKKETVAT